MITQYKRLLSLGIEHPYYSEGCRDFNFIISPDAARLLRRGKCLAKEHDGKLLVLFEANDNGAPLADLSGHRIRIGLKLCNPYFGNFTDFEMNRGPQIPLFENSIAPDRLVLTHWLEIVGPIFRHSLSEVTRPATVTIKQADGAVIRADEITLERNVDSITYDLPPHVTGMVSVEVNYPAKSATAFYCVEPQLNALGICAFIEVRIDAGFSTSPPDLQIVFRPKSETIKYYVITQNVPPSEIDKLSIVDAGFNEDDRSQVNFERILQDDLSSQDRPPRSMIDPGAKVTLFKSQTAVARREKARRKLQLRSNGEVLIAHLTQPGADRPNADMFIRITKP